MYKPLPDNVTISSSSIHELGLFAKEDIPQGENFGMSHLQFEEKIIRTPLGGFINHSNTPNCVKIALHYTNQDDPKIKFGYKKWNLVTVQDIKKGDELTVRYTWYKI